MTKKFASYALVQKNSPLSFPGNQTSLKSAVLVPEKDSCQKWMLLLCPTSLLSALTACEFTPRYFLWILESILLVRHTERCY